MNSLEFLQRLLARSPTESLLTLTAIHPDKRQPTPSRHIPIRDESQLMESLHCLHQTNELGWGAYFGVATREAGLSRWQRGGASQIVALPALFVDVDQRDPQAFVALKRFTPSPSWIVHSGGGFHAYWLLDRPTSDFKTAQHLLDQLATALNGDRLSVAQSMRLVRTRNVKAGRHDALCQVVHETDAVYSLDEWQRRFPIKPSYIRKEHAAQSRIASSLRELNPMLIDAITHRLMTEYGGVWRGSNWMAALCPCGHARDSPGAHFVWNPSIGCGVCHGKHGTMNLKTLREILGLDTAAIGGIYLNDCLFQYGNSKGGVIKRFKTM